MQETYLTLKHMKQPEPMPNLMRRRPALVIIRHVAPRQAPRQDIAPILLEGRAAPRCVGGEVADAEEAVAEVGEEVDVQVGVVALAQGRFHGGVVVARGPVVVDGEVGGDEFEGDAVGGVGFVQDGDLRDVRDSVYRFGLAGRDILGRPPGIEVG